MIGDRLWHRLNRGALAIFAVGAIGCIVGTIVEQAAFYPAWLCAYLFWLGVPLGAVTLVLVHDLTGGDWMASARPALNVAIATMPLATLAAIPAWIGLRTLYSWPDASGLANALYLNIGFFFGRYLIDVVLWNGLAAYALWPPRGSAIGIAPALSWLSGVGLLALAYTASFASIDWILSLDPQFWSAIFPMIVGAGWFNTALSLVLICIALAAEREPARGHMANLAALLLATTIFWAYVEFCQFLIVWEEDLSTEIPWYLHRIAGGWATLTWLVAAAGFFIPFVTLLWGPAKRNRGVVIATCAVILCGRALHIWWLVLPEIGHRPGWWLAGAAMLALGGAMLLLMLRQLRHAAVPFGSRLGAAR